GSEQGEPSTTNVWASVPQAKNRLVLYGRGWDPRNIRKEA
ncbi:unnamed protein product, partial [Brachionus calyciflorus]